MQGGRRVIVGVTGSVGNLEALRSAAAEARRREASLVAVHAWVPPGGDLAERRWSVPELRQVWQDAAWRRLCKASRKPASSCRHVHAPPRQDYGDWLRRKLSRIVSFGRRAKE